MYFYRELQNEVTVAVVAALSERREDGGRRPPLQAKLSLYSVILNRRAVSDTGPALSFVGHISVAVP